MNRKYLGDSYDAVKRLWHDIFKPELPLYAEPRFIPTELRSDFLRLTGIRVCPASRRPHALLNDPDTGIRLPGKPNQKESRKHIAITTIIQQLKDGAATCVVTFALRAYSSAAKPGRYAALDAAWHPSVDFRNRCLPS